MGEVFEADDLELGRIALKTIRPDISSSAIAFDRFRREVQLARKVTGPQVCRIHELFVLPSMGERPAAVFLTMEYLEGVTLTKRVKQSGPLPQKDALPIALDICEGLRLIHHQGIVHRDLKSANIMLCNRDHQLRAVVMDFGLAHDGMGDGAAADGTTVSVVSRSSGAIAGTPAYMAPEQFEGKPVSAAADIYALGVVLYEMVTGLHPYEADTPVGAAIRRARRRAPPSSVQHRIPRHWDRVIERCLEYDPEQRFQSAEGVAKALRASALSPSNLRKDYPWLVPIIAVVALAAMVWGLAVWRQWRQYYRPNTEGQRWYQAGVAALREGSYLKATRALENATREDSRFVMAHARLAEAWANLDFDGTAQREMLIASAGENRIPPLDRMYLDAVRATLTRDFKSALALYRKILDRLPSSEKAAGYLDLGMAYDRNGEPQRALDNYAIASSLNPDNPAPWLRAGTVETRLNRVTDANRAFSRAESLYSEEMNPEGQAELNYQRGYMASLGGHVSDAETYLQRSIDEAQRISSLQLQIRALTQLSSIECASGNTEAAVNHASDAIGLARDHQLDAWAAMGLARLANARLAQGSDHYNEADDAVSEARNLAVQTQQGRALALANVVLASLRDAEHRPDEVVKPATDALTYYRQNGYVEPAANATLLLLRAESTRGDLRQLLQSSLAFLTLAQNSGSSYLLVQAEHNLGNAYDAREQYPDALLHYEKALGLAGTNLNRGYEATASAEVLAKLGRFREAGQTLAPPAIKSALPTSIAGVEADALLMQAEYRAALDRANAALREQPEMLADEKQEFERRRAVAEAHLGRTAEALTDISEAIPADSDSKTAVARPALLQEAEIKLIAGQTESAYNSAGELLQQFETQGQLDSALRSALLAAAASRSLHNESDHDRYAKQAVDILSSLKHNWGGNTLQTYLSRPDIRVLVRNAAIPNWP